MLGVTQRIRRPPSLARHQTIIANNEAFACAVGRLRFPDAVHAVVRAGGDQLIAGGAVVLLWSLSLAGFGERPAAATGVRARTPATIA